MLQLLEASAPQHCSVLFYLNNDKNVINTENSNFVELIPLNSYSVSFHISNIYRHVLNMRCRLLYSMYSVHY
jgi:hypothetical protein